MKNNRFSFYLVIFLLFSIGVGVTLYRHYTFDIPWNPEKQQHVWSVEAKLTFVATGEPVKVRFSVPSTQAGFVKIGEHTASAGYGVDYAETEDDGRRIEWTKREAWGKQTLYYRTEMRVDDDHLFSTPSVKPKVEPYYSLAGSEKTAAERLLEKALAQSADAYSLTAQLIHGFNLETDLTQLLLKKKNKTAWLVEILHSAQIPAREIWGLTLEDGRRRQKLQSYLQVFSGDDYRVYDVATGRVVTQENTLLWEYFSQPLVDVIGGKNTQVNFSMIRQDIPISGVMYESSEFLASFFDFSIHSLPLSEQALFKGILLIPVGVLVVAFFRIFVGLRTSGTFMPVLIAMAFIQTSLATGLIGFILIVLTGLMIRSYLSKLNLLLVSRIAAVIITVIILIAILSVMAYQLGWSEGLKITFFPMIILSWTIERMSILWEEEGAHEVAIQGGGSLMVAVVTYMMITNEWVRHLTFNFLGLQLVFLSLVLLIGNYTGYRLLELRRFAPLAKKDD